ncbi:MAG TPA: glucose-1-phosphate adenylyltransferase [Anaerolineaceae bacterium]|nr:glucose-1-phosphate adenylyltransferase [Anaerolineaceae bacterium]
MKTRAIILAGGEGTRLGVLTSKRTKPAVPFAGKYRIIDFPLSNCVNSNIFDVMIIAQYRPHSLIDHIGAGSPWDLNRDFTGGVRIYTPYRGRGSSWFVGTADAVQQNFSFIKRGSPDLILILSGDHVYSMDYEGMIQSHINKRADLTIATVNVPIEEASRFGIVGVDPDNRVTSFIEKPEKPPSNLVNMGVYLFNLSVLNDALWADHLQKDSSHDYGKDILPNLIKGGAKVYAYPYAGYWVDVGTVESYWKAHMDLIANPPAFDISNRNWIIHTRTEERAPIKIQHGAIVEDSMICDGCVIKEGAQIIRSILSPGTVVEPGACVKESIVLTDSQIQKGAILQRAILDKRVIVGEGASIGGMTEDLVSIAMVGKNSFVPANCVVMPGGMISTDVISSDYSTTVIENGQIIHTRRLPNEI